VGERYGKTRIGDKSLEGTTAFILASMTAGFFLTLIGIAPLPAVIVLGALIAAGVELIPLPINDNLVIPIVSGAVMESVVRLLG
jgi:dolichol kinase